jgi:hypothetical protein
VVFGLLIVGARVQAATVVAPIPPPVVDSTGHAAHDSLATARPDSLKGFPGDSVKVSVADTTTSPAAPGQKRRVRTVEVTSRWDQPRWVMLRSLVFPGWGQAHNGSWLKAAGVAAGEWGLTWKIVQDRRTLDQLNTEVEAARAVGDDALEADLVVRYNDLLDGSNAREWLLGAVVAYAVLDAYIDAQFRSFKAVFDTDPALPGGHPASKKMRFSLRWSF